VNFPRAGRVLAWTLSVPEGRWAAYARGRRPAGGRRFAALVIVLVAAGMFGWAMTHATGACACGPPIHFGRDQPGFRRIHGPLPRALSRLPVRLRLAPGIGAPVGAYRSRDVALILYGARSRYGVFRFTAARRSSGFDAGALRAMASECDVCAENRLVLLAPGVRGALLAGGNGPNSLTWLEHGLWMAVLGPACSFDGDGAIAAARGLARANAS
jgi:hypothetical protein